MITAPLTNDTKTGNAGPSYSYTTADNERNSMRMKGIRILPGAAHGNDNDLSDKPVDDRNEDV
jgi:hypothetical protein